MVFKPRGVSRELVEFSRGALVDSLLIEGVFALDCPECVDYIKES